MFGSLGVPELLFIFGLALLIFGPKKLPQVGRTLGRGMAEFRKASNDLKRTINAEIIDDELRDSDPRKMARDSLRDIKDGLNKASKGGTEASTDDGVRGRRPGPSADPDGSVARQTSSAGAGDDDGSEVTPDEPPADGAVDASSK